MLCLDPVRRSVMAWDSVINDAMDEWHKRLWSCVHVKGKHFEHLILFKSTLMLMFRSISMLLS